MYTTPVLYYVCMWQMRSNNQKTKSNAKIKHLLFGGESKAERGKVRRKRREGYRDFWGHLLLPVICVKWAGGRSGAETRRAGKIYLQYLDWKRPPSRGTSSGGRRRRTAGNEGRSTQAHAHAHVLVRGRPGEGDPERGRRRAGKLNASNTQRQGKPRPPNQLTQLRKHTAQRALRAKKCGAAANCTRMMIQ